MAQTITVSPASVTIAEGQRIQLSYILEPKNTNANIVWGSRNSYICSVNMDTGLIYGVSHKYGEMNPASTYIFAQIENDPDIYGECNVMVVESVRVTGINIRPDNLTLEKGSSSILVPIIEPSNATVQDVTWLSEDDNIATVNPNGKVTGLIEGSTYIVCKDCDGQNITAKCKINVTPVFVKSIELNKTSLTLKHRENETIIPIISPVDADNKTLTWEALDPKVVDIEITNNECKVYGKLPGKTTVICSAIGKENTIIFAECEVIVEAILIENLNLDPSYINLELNRTSTIQATFIPINVSYTGLTWTSNNEKVATVDKGTITAKSIGQAEISCTTAAVDKYGKTITKTVNVNVIPVKVQSITLDKKDIVIKEHDTVDIKATISPTDTSNKVLSWESSNPTIASVNNGKVTGIKAGNTKITCSSTDGTGVKAECNVTVNPIKVSSIEIRPNVLTLTEGDLYNVEAVIKPDNASNKDVVWTSSNKVIAVVNGGEIAALKAGEATITCSAVDGSTVRGTCLLKVEPKIVYAPATDIILSPNPLLLVEGQSKQLTTIIMPTNYTDDLIWETDNENIATVRDGIVTGVYQGKTTVRCLAYNNNIPTGIIGTCEVIVSNAQDKDNSSSLRPAKSSGISYVVDTVGIEIPQKFVTVSDADYPLVDSKNIDWNDSKLSYISQIDREKIIDFIGGEERSRYVTDDNFDIYAKENFPSWLKNGSVKFSTEALDIMDYLLSRCIFLDKKVDELHQELIDNTVTLVFSQEELEQKFGVKFNEYGEMITPLVYTIYPNETSNSPTFKDIYVGENRHFEVSVFSKNNVLHQTLLEDIKKRVESKCCEHVECGCNEAISYTDNIGSVDDVIEMRYLTESSFSGIFWRILVDMRGWPSEIMDPENGDNDIKGFKIVLNGNRVTVDYRSLECYVKKVNNYPDIWINNVRYYFIPENVFDDISYYIVSAASLQQMFGPNYSVDFENYSEEDIDIISPYLYGRSNIEGVNALTLPADKNIKIEVFPRYYGSSVNSDGTTYKYGSNDISTEQDLPSIGEISVDINEDIADDLQVNNNETVDSIKEINGEPRKYFERDLQFTLKDDHMIEYATLNIWSSPTYYVSRNDLSFKIRIESPNSAISMKSNLE